MPTTTATPMRRARGRGALVALTVTLAIALVAPSTVDAQQEPAAGREPAELTEAEEVLAETLAAAPEDEPPSPDDVFVAVVAARAAEGDAALTLLGAVDAATVARSAAFEAELARQEAQAVVDEAALARNAARATLAEERQRLSDLTVKAYVSGGDVAAESERALLAGDTTDPSHGKRVVFEQVLRRQEQITDEARAAASATREALTAARTRRDARADTAEARTATARAAARDQDRALQARDAAAAELVAAEARLRQGPRGTAVPQDVAIVGLPRLSAGDLAAWFAASPYQPKVATPIEDYATWFIQEGATEGIRGDIAFAQAVLETGGFANRDTVVANNFSGIGHCDSCDSGWTFPSPRMGVRAQIQLLKSYAMKQPPYVNDLVDKRLRGPAGCCDTWGDLTTVWATDPTYGPKVMLLYSSMVETALARRAAGLGFDDPAPIVPAPA